jgi:hypothetical protein
MTDMSLLLLLLLLLLLSLLRAISRHIIQKIPTCHLLSKLKGFPSDALSCLLLLLLALT